MVVGCSGSGKSTLAMGIEAHLGLPHISLDRDMRWLPGWQIRDRAEQRALHERHVSGARWVIDGTSVSLFPSRLRRADLVIWMRPPLLASLLGVARRVARGYGRVRPDMAPGCPEGLPDREFLSYIWTFERKQSPRIVAEIDRHRPSIPVVTIRSHRQANRLLASSQRGP